MIVTKEGSMFFAICKIKGKVFMGFAPDRREAIGYCLELLESM